MTWAYTVLKRCPVCGKCSKRVVKHIRHWHPGDLDRFTFILSNKRGDLLRPTLAGEMDSLPKLLVEVKRRS